MDRPKRSATAAVSHVGLNGGAHSLFHLGCFRDHLVAELSSGLDDHAQKLGATSWLSEWPHAAQR
jgi:hypothetical protein